MLTPQHPLVHVGCRSVDAYLCTFDLSYVFLTDLRLRASRFEIRGDDKPEQATYMQVGRGLRLRILAFKRIKALDEQARWI